ncbi:hypothetical protein Tco_0550908 [Tanacetum coccineum]
MKTIATKLGTPLMLDSHTSDMYMQSWGTSSYARALIVLRAYVELKDTIVVLMSKLVGKDSIRVLFVLSSDVAKSLKNSSQAPRDVLVGPKKDEESRKEVSNLNPFDMLNLVENNVDLGIDGENSNLASKEANAS